MSSLGTALPPDDEVRPPPTGRATPPDARPSPAEPRWRRWAMHPLARILIFVVLLVAGLIAFGASFGALGWSGKTAPEWQRLLSTVVAQCVPPVLAYLLLVRFIERRRPDELAWRRWVPETAIGLAAGFLFISAVVGVLWLAGSYVVTGVNPQAPWLRPLLVTGIGAAVLEEIVFRGVLFRVVEERWGTWIALAVSALFFGGGHIGNPGATWWSIVAIAIEAGLLCGLVYHLSRSLPMVMGLHAAWNFVQGTVYGIPVSGTDASGWIVASRQGPTWLSGGEFGAEASVVAVLVSACIVVALAVHAVRRGTIVPRRR